jgi:hypothetical protein
MPIIDDSNKINIVLMPIVAVLALVGIVIGFCVDFFPHTAAPQDSHIYVVNGKVVTQQEAEAENAALPSSVMSSADQCPTDSNVIIDLAPGDRVRVLKSLAPTDPADQALPKDSPLSKKMYLTYVKVLDGPHANEYCWASTANIQ